MRVFYLPKAAAFIANLDESLDGRARRMIRLLESRGHELRMPFSKPVEEGVFELRAVGTIPIRLLYFFHEGDAVVVHAFFKKTEQLRRRDIEYALQARKDYLAGL